MLSHDRSNLLVSNETCYHQARLADFGVLGNHHLQEYDENKNAWCMAHANYSPPNPYGLSNIF